MWQSKQTNSVVTLKNVWVTVNPCITSQGQIFTTEQLNGRTCIYSMNTQYSWRQEKRSICSNFSFPFILMRLLMTWSPILWIYINNMGNLQHLWQTNSNDRLLRINTNNLWKWKPLVNKSLSGYQICHSCGHVARKVTQCIMHGKLKEVCEKTTTKCM